MKPLIFIASLLIVFVFVSSCEHNNSKLITKKIQYDVNIKSPSPDYDWWIQNLPGPDREEIVEMILEGAKSGKFKAYDYFHKPLNVNQVNSILKDTMVLHLMREEPPYEEYDTTIIHLIENADIQKLRFLEKWEINEGNLQMTKTIYAIAPVASRKDFNGIDRWQPLFWIYTDESFLKGGK